MSVGTVISRGPISVAVAADPNSNLVERLASLEREVRQLRARVTAVERLLGNAGEHTTDRTVVREKAVYDWQG